MEFMDGGTLAHLLQRLRVIEEPYLAVLARQVRCWQFFYQHVPRVQQVAWKCVNSLRLILPRPRPKSRFEVPYRRCQV
jgi:hypothetical protein